MRTRHTCLLALAGVALALAAGCAHTQSQQPSAASATSMTGSAKQASAPESSSVMPGMKSGSIDPTMSANAGVGEKIFALGVTPSGPVAFKGGSPDVGNGACANCHGDAAQGGDGPMIGWPMLTAKSSAMAGMPQYSYTSADQVYVAVTTGVRPDGTQLKTNMPRYDLKRADFDQLVGFLKTK